ncbi:MAG TPA: MAPEG family protein [Thermoanaerobaculia bacterium]|nr:MAPEG family protein [Thermoanaerobaculia bacterium]
MTAPIDVHILYPIFAMFLLVALVMMRMRSLRFAAVRNNQVAVGYYKTFHGAEEPEPLRAIARNFANLFEMPVLFYVVSLMAYSAGQVNWWLVALAWVYVALRYVHTWVHLTSNQVMVRFTFYMLSNIVLAAMWVMVLVLLVTHQP